MTSAVQLRDVVEDDLAVFFEHQRDPEANYMAAFTRKDPADREAFMAHWTRIRSDESVIARTILCNGQVAGSVMKFEHQGKPEVSYWIGKEYWGRGLATRALALFLGHITTRPLYAGAAKDNLASIRVLQKCGFTIIGEDKGFSNARGEEVEEFFLMLQGDVADGAR